MLCRGVQDKQLYLQIIHPRRHHDTSKGVFLPLQVTIVLVLLKTKGDVALLCFAEAVEDQEVLAPSNPIEFDVEGERGGLRCSVRPGATTAS